MAFHQTGGYETAAYKPKDAKDDLGSADGQHALTLGKLLEQTSPKEWQQLSRQAVSTGTNTPSDIYAQPKGLAPPPVFCNPSLIPLTPQEAIQQGFMRPDGKLVYPPTPVPDWDWRNPVNKPYKNPNMPDEPPKPNLQPCAPIPAIG